MDRQGKPGGRHGGFGGQRRSGGFGGQRRSGGFGGQRRFSRDDDRPREMHKATCSECGADCEVPFKPIQGKPVYCKDCYTKRLR